MVDDGGKLALLWIVHCGLYVYNGRCLKCFLLFACVIIDIFVSQSQLHHGEEVCYVVFVPIENPKCC